jgi:hypothetical protein
VKAYVSKRAARAAERLAARWREYADYPDVFALEFREMVEILESTHSPGSLCPTRAHPRLKRILLRKSHCHAYFEIDERHQRIQILQLWDARRGRPPKL